MAELAAWTSAQSRAQLMTIAWLRWRILVNGFRRGKQQGSTTGLVLVILVRIVVWTIFAGILSLPVFACGLAGYIAIARHHPYVLGTVLWTILLSGLFISINISPATPGFDLKPLMRFPISFSQYFLIRMFFGFVAIPTVAANFCLAAAAVGIGIANHALFLWAALVLGLFALHNIFLTRMIFAWIDRWLATRRAREISGVVIVLVSFGVQIASLGNSGRRGMSIPAFQPLLNRLHPVTRFLPPSLAASAVLDHSLASADASLAGLLAFALAFLAIFAFRLQKEFHGENLNESAVRIPGTARSAFARTARVEAANRPDSALPLIPRLPSTVAACLQKELIYLRRSGAQIYGLITPLFFVFILTRRNSIFGNHGMLLPYAVSYTLLGLLAGLYNVLGANGAGYNFYLLAPIRLRDVILSKNLVSIALIGAEILLTCFVVALIGGAFPPPAMLTATLTWAAFALLVNLTAGNLRSLLAPTYFELGQLRRPVAAKGSGWISLLVLFSTIALGLPIIYLCQRFNRLWLATPIILLMAVAALVVYLAVLGQVDNIALNHRDELTDALCKK